MGSVAEKTVRNNAAALPIGFRRYSIMIFFALAFLLGAGAVYIVALGAIPSNLFFVAGLSAGIAGVVMTALEDGRTGLSLLAARLMIWRSKPGFWLFALLFPVSAAILGSSVNPLLSGDQPELGSLLSFPTYVLMFIVFILIAGVGQELGWAGYLTPRLQSRYSALVSSAMRAALVSVWHIPILIYAGSGNPSFYNLHYSGWIAEIGFVLTLILLMGLFILPISVITTWVFNNTRGSLLLVSVFHGSEIWIGYWMLNSGIDPRNIANWWGYGAVLVATAAAMLFIEGAANLSRKRKRIVH